MNQGEVTIRLANRADAPALAGVHVAAWRESYRDLIPESVLATLSTDDRLSTWRAILGESPDE
jgi:hypothetical protein